MRAFWSGQLSFGLVNIPVNVYTATDSHTIDLDLLHKEDMGHIRYKKVCEVCGEGVTEDDIVRGYKHAKDEYIVLSQKDLQTLHPEGTDAITITSFVDPAEVPYSYFEKPYFLAPEKSAGKAYALLREAMEKSDRVAIAKYIFRNKEHLGIVAPEDDGLMLYQVRFPADLREPEFALPSSKVDKKELDLALDLIKSLSGEFRPEDYEDRSREEFEHLVEAKLAGSVPLRKAPAAAPTKVVDLVATLKKSLAAEQEGKPRRKAAQRKKAAS